jgi:hypothetical protein
LTSNPADSPGKIDLPDGRLDEIKPMAKNASAHLLNGEKFGAVQMQIFHVS